MQHASMPVERVNLVELVSAAAQSTLGLIALLIIILAIIALVFFHHESARVKVSIFVAMLVGAGMLTGSVINVAPQVHDGWDGLEAQMDSIPPSEQPPTTASDPDASGGDPFVLDRELLPTFEIPDLQRRVPAVPSPESAYALIEAHDWDGALAAWAARIRKYPRDEFNYFHRATALLRLGDLEGAVSDLDTVISLQPTHGSAFNNRGMIKLRQRRIDEACTDFRHAVELSNATAERNLERHCS